MIGQIIRKIATKWEMIYFNMKQISSDELELLWRAWLKDNPNTGCNWLGKWAWSVCKKKEFIAQLEKDGYRIVVNPE